MRNKSSVLINGTDCMKFTKDKKYHQIFKTYEKNKEKME